MEIAIATLVVAVLQLAVQIWSKGRV